MTQVLTYTTDRGITPLTDPAFGEDPVYVPDCLRARLFADAGNLQEPVPQVYALLDAGKIPFLTDRLAASGLAHQCLYDWQDFADETEEVAPWLVELKPDNDMTRWFFSFDPEDDNPFHMLALAGGILIRSHATLAGLRAHLRHYTVLPDENGARLVFRMQEPGYLDALLAASSVDEVATFFAQVADVTYLLPSLEDNKWDAISFAPVQRGDYVTARPALDKTRRTSMRYMRNTIRARALAVETGTDLADRTRRADTYFRIFMTGYDNTPTVVKTHALLDSVPPGAHGPYWDAVNSGKHSLGFLNYKLAAHYGLEDMVQ